MQFQAYRSGHAKHIALCVVVATFFFNMAHQVRGATHVVGDRDSWSLFTQSTNWTRGKEFHVGDILVFNYEEEEHNVMKVNSTVYEDCLKDPYISLFHSGSDSVVLSEVGQTWFICGVGDHCVNGQKLSINVVP